ncbi:MAG: hypothetical protein AB7O96_20345 [Pseudobdellovibrionaceae bacterium]
MLPNFHLSIEVKSIEESIVFFTRVLKAEVIHRDSSGYVNIDWFGSQITLAENGDMGCASPNLHFGVNLTLRNFDELFQNIMREGKEFVHMEPEIRDKGSSIERKKMFLKCPTGYLVEIKGYWSQS